VTARSTSSSEKEPRERPDRRELLLLGRLGRPDVTQRGQLSFDRVEPLAMRRDLSMERPPDVR
jgi:hypothetical protein